MSSYIVTLENHIRKNPAAVEKLLLALRERDFIPDAAQPLKESGLILGGYQGGNIAEISKISGVESVALNGRQKHQKLL